MVATSQADLIGSIYDERSGQYDVSFHGLLAEEYIRVAQPKHGECVLDLACGTGLVTLAAEEKVGSQGHVVGIDISAGMLNRARHKAQQKGSNITFFQHDITDLSDLDLLSPGHEGFDLITCAAALVLLPDPLQAIKNWMTLLKPGGRLITDVAAKDVHVPSRILSRISETLGEPLQWDQSWVQNEDSLKTLLLNAGLRVETVFLSKTFQIREYTAANASQTFEQVVSGPMFRNFGEPAIRDEARRLFVGKFAEKAGSSGVLLDEAKMYFGVAYKP
ncbi:S-adenosyl-L-methionine-dependent methyltransferase [Aspergillus ambiguus]|uniref:class I SAM-dependent methyltransferase n=1 Tax=Aspergillus ambiguus TaxID=176160 RepID=UPI003CCDD06A